MFKNKFVRQENLKDCGVACLLMIIRYYKGNYPLEQLRVMTNTDKNGTTAFNLIKAAEKIGFDARGYKCSNYKYIKCPSIAHVVINKTYHHFVVVKKIDFKKKIIIISDPAFGIKKYTFMDFDKIWTKTIIILYPTRKINNIDSTKIIKKTIYEIIKPFQKLFVLILILSIIYTVLNIINTFYFKIIIDYKDLSITTHIYLFIFFLVMMIIKIIIDFIRNRLLIYINKKVDNHLMNITFKHLLSLPWQYFNSRMTGDIIARLNDLSYVKELISKAIIILLVDGILVIGSLIVMININIVLAILAILILLIYFVIVYSFNHKINYYIMHNQEAEALLSSSLVEAITGINTIKNLGIEKEIYHNVMIKHNDLVDNTYAFNKKYNMIKMFKDFITSSGSLIILLLGAILMLQNKLVVGDFIIFNFFLLFFMEPMKNIFEIEPLLRASFNALVRTSEFYNIEKDINMGISTIENGNLVVNNLNYAYNNLDKVISNVNFQIASGEKIMITGPSGSGKSTIAKMLIRYLDVGCNQIFVDGSDILNYSLTTIRNTICYVSQDEILFNDSLYNNIKLYRNINEEEITKVLSITKIEEILKRHNLDYHMLIEENGANLSGGEKQRLIIARALLKNSNIYIFDESMSEMNVTLERSIIENIFANYRDKTFIVISHRLNNADLYDRVINLGN